LCWHIPPPQAGLQPLGSGRSISSDDFDSVGELYLEDDFSQLRLNFRKKRRLRSVILFKSVVLFRRVPHDETPVPSSKNCDFSRLGTYALG